jgi:hypothetical protein
MNVDPHVGVHARYEDVETAVAIEVEHLGAHRAPWTPGKVSRCRVAKALSSLIQPNVIATLHVEDVQIGELVAVYIEDGCVPTPASVDERHRSGHILKPVPAEVSVQDARFRAIGMQMSHERIAEANVVTAAPALIRGVHAYVRDEQIQQAIAVIVEEDRAGRVADVSHTGSPRDVAKPSTACILEETVAVPNRGDEEVGISIVIRVAERAAGRNHVRHRETCRGGSVDEAPGALVQPELVGAELCSEIEIGVTVPIDVGRAHARAVVVVYELVVLARIVDDTIPKRDTAGAESICVAEIVEHARPSQRICLLAASLEEPGWSAGCLQLAAVGILIVPTGAGAQKTDQRDVKARG